MIPEVAAPEVLAEIYWFGGVAGLKINKVELEIMLNLWCKIADPGWLGLPYGEINLSTWECLFNTS